MPSLQPTQLKARISAWLMDHSSWIRKKAPIWADQCEQRKTAFEQRWHALPKTEQHHVTMLLFMAGFILIQFIWIIALQVQVSNLSSQAEIQDIRITQLEQTVQKHNNLLYSTYTTVWDIQEKWSDLNFRVMQNTWKLDK